MEARRIGKRGSRRKTWYPWESLGIRGWRPIRDPMPATLNHWSDGSVLAWQIVGAGWGLVALVLGWLLWLGRRHDRAVSAG